MCQLKVTIFIVFSCITVASFCIYQVKNTNDSVTSTTKVLHDNEYDPCKKEYHGYCLNEGECFYIKEEGVVACHCTLNYGGQRCDKWNWWH